MQDDVALVTSLGKMICISIPHSGIQIHTMDFSNICAASYSIIPILLNLIIHFSPLPGKY